MAKRHKQHEFTGMGFNKPSDVFGGSLLKGNPKGKRPLDTKMPTFLTLRATKSTLRLPKTFKLVDDLIQSTAKKYGMRIYKTSNVGNHLHLVFKVSRLELWSPFIRELTGRIAQAVMAVVGAAGAAGFWLYRPHTRIVRGWKKAYQAVKDYIHLNQLEAEGHISRKEISSLKQLRLLWADGPFR